MDTRVFLLFSFFAVKDRNLFADFKRVMHAQYKLRARYARVEGKADTPTGIFSYANLPRKNVEGGVLI